LYFGLPEIAGSLLFLDFVVTILEGGELAHLCLKYSSRQTFISLCFLSRNSDPHGTHVSHIFLTTLSLSSSKANLLYIPGSVDIPGNESVDRATKYANHDFPLNVKFRSTTLWTLLPSPAISSPNSGSYTCKILALLTICSPSENPPQLRGPHVTNPHAQMKL